MKLLKRSFFDNMILWYLFIATASFTAMLLFTNFNITHLLTNERTASLQSQARLIATQYAKEYFDNNTNKIQLNEQLESLRSLLGTDIWIADDKGQLIASSMKLTNSSSYPIYITQLEFPINLYHSFATTGNFSGYFNSDTLSVGIPLTSSEVFKGYIILHSSLSDLSEIKSSILNVITLAYMLVLLLSLLFLYHFSKNIINPLEQINQAAWEYSNGNFEEKLDVEDKNEIGQLADSLNNMADELQKMEDYRKNFIANVSHDFRSPLTSIKGYLEAIQDGTIPPEKQGHYIEVVLNETSRLTKLTSSLIQLNDFNSNTLILKKSIFDINSMVLNTIDSFEGTASKRHVIIFPDLPSVPTNVYADKDKINQVIYNLIDNALKFSHPSSSIFITVLDNNTDKIVVSVKDTGDGISIEHQRHIWERFYKADTSRGRDKSGTGLGLSIVKEIIKAHDENITLTSSEGQGADFSFTLPKAPK